METEIPENKVLAIVGLDISYNSTGLVIRLKNQTIFLRITPGPEPNSSLVGLHHYHKVESNTKDFSYDDIAKIKSGTNLAGKILSILKHYQKIHHITDWDFRQEGNVMNSFSRGKGTPPQLLRLVDMIAINSIIKTFILRIPNSKLTVYAPLEIKKAFTGRGRPSKEQKALGWDSKTMMINRFMELYPGFDMKGKMDDVIDAYALSTIPGKK